MHGTIQETREQRHRCQGCGRAFKARRSHAKTCSEKCRMRLYRARKRNAPLRFGSMFTSLSDDWATPQDLFDELNTEFNFTLDVCALPDNAKCPTYYTPADDGLTQPWAGTVWCNPPYGRTIGQWIEKAIDAARCGATVVALVPARTD